MIKNLELQSISMGKITLIAYVIIILTLLVTGSILIAALRIASKITRKSLKMLQNLAVYRKFSKL